MQRRRASGYSLTELLVVVAIIGALSLITVPAFMNFQRASIFKSAMRNFTADLRAARATSIQQSFDVRIQFRTGAEGPTTKVYQFTSSRDRWATSTPLEIRKSSVRTIDGPVWFESSTNLPVVGGLATIEFHPDGTAEISNNAMEATAVMATNWTNIAFNRYRIRITRAGQIKVSNS